MSFDELFTLLFLVLFGFGAGLFSFWMYQKNKVGSLHRLAEEIIRKAEDKGDLLLKNNELQLKKRELDLERLMDGELQKERHKLRLHEERLKEREDKLERRMGLMEKKLSDTEKKEAILTARRTQVEEDKKQAQELLSRLIQELESLSGLTSQEAREFLLKKIEQEVKQDAANLTRRAQKEAEEEIERLVSTLIATTVNRLAVPCVSELTVTTVALPNDEMKGRIIGREGRNIRTLEQITGVNFLIDDTPGVVVISGFDPIRKQVAKVTLQELIADGRIHPARIEEVVEKAQQTVQKQIRKFGEDAAIRAGATNLHPEILHLLGKLKFRYSYGQNVLDHSLEVSHIMGIMAAELGLNVALAKRIGLLHDIGKAVSHEVEGTHALIGKDLALRYGESDEVANGIGCHHGEIDPITIEGSLCTTADRLSATRPGARIEAVEEYVKRLKKLEDIAFEFPGVEKAYALQAGREVRIAVLPDMIDDHGLVNLARDLSRRIEKELTYPGKIKVTVIREKRIIEYAI